MILQIKHLIQLNNIFLFFLTKQNILSASWHSQGFSSPTWTSHLTTFRERSGIFIMTKGVVDMYLSALTERSECFLKEKVERPNRCLKSSSGFLVTTWRWMPLWRKLVFLKCKLHSGHTHTAMAETMELTNVCNNEKITPFSKLPQFSFISSVSTLSFLAYSNNTSWLSARLGWHRRFQQEWVSVC